jgi:hypothetical protein
MEIYRELQMPNNFDTELDHVMGLVDDSLSLCINYYNTEVDENTKDPFSLVLNKYDLYVTLKKAEEIYYAKLKGFELCSFEPVSPETFYSYLDDSVKEKLVGKMPKGIFDDL